MDPIGLRHGPRHRWLERGSRRTPLLGFTRRTGHPLELHLPLRGNS